MNAKKKVAVVTGAARGIGLAIAKSSWPRATRCPSGH